MLARLLILATCVVGSLGTYGADYGSGDAGASGAAQYGSGSAQGADAAPAAAAPAAPAKAPCPEEQSQGSAPGAGASQATADQAGAGAGGTMHEVIVGGKDAAQLVYTPNVVMAAAGDTIKFMFKEKNHTVTQSTFDKPCSKMDGGVDSGFKPNADGAASPPPEWTYTVKDAKPVWFFCYQKGHCGKGMVFAVNPTAEKSMDAYVAAAKAQGGAGEAAPPPSAAAPPPPADTAAAPPPADTAGAAHPPPPPSDVPSAPVIASPSAVATPLAMPTVVAGTMGAGGACSCYCGMGAFPVAGQGAGMMGGYAGAVPMSGGSGGGAVDGQGSQMGSGAGYY